MSRTPPPQRPNPMYERRLAKPTMHPRRVTGGIRLQFKAGATIGPEAPSTAENPPANSAEARNAEQAAGSPPPSAAGVAAGWSWASARWMRLAEDHAPGDQLAEGLEYAQMGQTRSLDLKPGAIQARVQGRMPNAYKVAFRLPTFTPEQWESVTTAMASQAKYAASLLASELPPNIEDLFIPSGLNLFPTGPSDLSCSCDCDLFLRRAASPAPGGAKRSARNAPPVQPWCKHICCAMFLLAERLAVAPLTIFSLRGLPEADLLERLRQQRALVGMQRAGNAAAPVYSPHVPGLPRADAPLEEVLHSFWSAADADAIDSIEMPIAPPEVSHPLLRRVGPSPFTGAKFPMVGLLATCYDVISQATIDGVKGDDCGSDPAQVEPKDDSAG